MALQMTLAGTKIFDAVARTHPAAPPEATFEALLSHEVMASERRRMLALAGLLTAIFVFILLLIALAPAFVLAAIFHGAAPVHVPLIIFPPFIAYELGASALVTFFDRRGRRLPTIGRYANATIETSFPTLGIYVLAHYVDPAAAFSSWLASLYFLFIILSTLRLDFKLSVFTGALAAVELFALASSQLGLSWTAEDFNHSIIFHLTRSAILLAGGFFAGSAGATLKAQFERAVAAASARDRVTNLFGQHVSPE